MKFRLITFIVLLFALSTSTYAVTAEECLDAAYQTLEAYYNQLGLAGERDIRCTQDKDFVDYYTSHYCEGTLSNSTRAGIKIVSAKSEEAPLTCNVFFQGCDGSSLEYGEPLDSKGDYGKANKEVSKLCRDVPEPIDEFWIQEYIHEDPNGTYQVREAFARRLFVKEYNCVFSKEYTRDHPEWTHSDAHFVWNADAGFYTGTGDTPAGYGMDIVNDVLCSAFFNPSDPVYELICDGPTLTRVSTWAQARSGDSGYCESFP